MCSAVPVFEAKNRLPFFIHQAETEGPVPITRHNQEVAYIISKSDYEEMKNAADIRLRLEAPLAVPENVRPLAQRG